MAAATAVDIQFLFFSYISLMLDAPQSLPDMRSHIGAIEMMNNNKTASGKQESKTFYNVQKRRNEK